MSNLGKYIQFKNGKSSPERDESGEFPVFGSNGIIGHSSKYNSDNGTIVIGRVGSYCGSVHYSSTKCWVTDNAIIATPIYKDESLFWFYYLKSLNLNMMKVGSGQPLLNQKILSSLPLQNIENIDKKHIGNILFGFDQKILLNTQTNQTFEHIAQTIYKSWFIDYEPTRAKAAVLAASGSMADAETAAMTAISGKSAAELAAHKQQHPARYQQFADLAAAFPAALVPTDDFGEIPEGWEVKKVGDIAKIVKGKKPKNIYPSQEDNFLPHILVAALEGKYTEFCETAKMTVSKITDTLVLMDGSASGRIAVGHHGVVGSTLAKIELFDNKYWAILYQLLKSKEKDIQDNTTGTSIPHADKARINDYSLSVCEGCILDFYNQFFEKSLFQSIENRKQSNLLESIRDTLLPKLLSGEFKQE